MANEEHLSIIKQGVDTWNGWMREHTKTQPDLSRANLEEANLKGVNLRWANLKGAILKEAKLDLANLNGVNLSGANLSGASLNLVHLLNANLSKANLSGADLSGASLIYADLNGADLSRANLIDVMLTDANLENANLNGCRVYGISAWALRTNKETKQSDLIITAPNEANVIVGDIEVAQFIYLLLNRKKLRNVLETITSKAVLLLGRFTNERKAILDALAEELRKQNLLPIIFDFERSTNLDFTETIKILAGLSLFVIVDITKPKSAPQELTATVPDYQIPFVPIIEEGEEPYSMFRDFMKYDWVRQQVLTYSSKEELSENLGSCILDWAWEKHLELQQKKNKGYECISIKAMLAQNKKSTT